MKNRSIRHSDDWATPKTLYNELDAEFHFDFDPCPLFSEFDGLQIEWGSSNFINPPYSRKLKEAFVRKAVEESSRGKQSRKAVCITSSCIHVHRPIPRCNKAKCKRDTICP